MDNIAPLNHRKRKSDVDDAHDPVAADPVVPPVVMLVDPPAQAPSPASNAPRQTWIAADSWSSPSSPQVSSPLSAQAFNPYPSRPPKRPRVDTSGALRIPPKRAAKRPQPKPRPARHGNDIEDIGIVSTADPGPSSGSLLHLRGSSFSSKSPDHFSPSAVPLISIDSNSHHIPSLQPLINRHTLKELDLDAILRNPQLRHDLLFDPGLQFRPTCSRRKRDMSEKYWSAVLQELETGCTCVSFDLLGKPRPIVCACSQVPIPALNPVVAYSPTLSVLTLRMPSRIRSLLSEFLEVLLLVIQPLSSISGMYVNPNTFKSQMQEHSAQAVHIRSVFDPALIEQELTHNLFDPSALFNSIGHTLKGHCAPMRDHAVEVMVQAAQACAPGGTGNKTDALKAVRMCMEILELMKLDIANHQLQTLRPFLIRTSGQFELKTFKNRKEGDISLRITREWLRMSHRSMLACTHPISHPLYPTGYLRYDKLVRNQQTYLATLKGLVDLVFNPPSSAPPSPLSLPATPLTQAPLPTIFPLPGYPETSYLDNSRLLLLGTDAADVTTLYMFLLLYRQLVFSEQTESSAPQDSPKIDDTDLLKLKAEIRDIGSSRLGYCISAKYSSSGADSPTTRMDRKEAERRHNVKQDIVLQIAMRAKEARYRTISTPPSPSSPVGEAPDERTLRLAQRWVDSNMQPDSALSVMLRDRVRDVVFNAVVTLAYPGRDSTTGKLSSIDFFSFGSAVPEIAIPLGAATGMEPLADEIRTLSEKISRLALIHLNAYLPLYEQDGFFDS